MQEEVSVNRFFQFIPLRLRGEPENRGEFDDPNTGARWLGPERGGLSLSQVGDRERSLGKYGDSSVGCLCFEVFLDRFGDVVTRRQMSAPNRFFGKGAENPNVSIALDEGLNLGLPLFGASEAWTGQEGQNLLRGLGRAHESVKRAVGR